jgi:hypothetical protein
LPIRRKRAQTYAQETLFNSLLGDKRIVNRDCKAIAVFASLLSIGMQASPAAEKDAKQQIAQIVADLVAHDAAFDVQTLEHYFKIRDLHDRLSWSGPLSGAEAAQFTASYAPADADLGITGLFITWQVVPSPPRLFSARFLDRFISDPPAYRRGVPAPSARSGEI